MRSEAALIDLLQRANRPVRDAAFLTSRNVWSKTASVRIDGLTIAATAGSAMHFETAENPQYAVVLPIFGTSRVVEGTKVASFGGSQVVVCSFSNRFVVDYSEYSYVTIHPDVEQLLDVLQIESRDRGIVRERLFETATAPVPTGPGGIDYYAALRSTIRMVNDIDGDEARMERFGLGTLMTRLIAQLTLRVHPDLARYMMR